MTLVWKRKVQKISGSRYIAIPLIWCESNNVKPQNTLDISMLSDGSLRIVPINKVAADE
jgi:hypothetical protein